jgi:proline utilization trans-activator
VHTDIASTVYGSNGRFRKKFVLSIKTVLDNLAGLAEELRTSFPLHTDKRFGGISRLPAHSHLYYYQVRAFSLLFPESSDESRPS